MKSLTVKKHLFLNDLKEVLDKHKVAIIAQPYKTDVEISFQIADPDNSPMQSNFSSHRHHFTGHDCTELKDKLIKDLETKIEYLKIKLKDSQPTQKEGE